MRAVEEFIPWGAGDGSLVEVEVEEDIERLRRSNRLRAYSLRAGCRIHLNAYRIWALARRCLTV